MRPSVCSLLVRNYTWDNCHINVYTYQQVCLISISVCQIVMVLGVFLVKMNTGTDYNDPVHNVLI